MYMRFFVSLVGQSVAYIVLLDIVLHMSSVNPIVPNPIRETKT